MAAGFAGGLGGFSARAGSDERARAEVELCAFLEREKYQGPAWEFFVHELLAYGVDRVRMLTVSGTVFRDSPGLIQAELRPGDIDDLVHDVVLAGFRLFVREGLIRKRWSPEKGASLTTYFIGACKLVFPDCYRAWVRRRRRDGVERPVADIEAILPTVGEDNAEVNALLDRLTELLSAEEVRIFMALSEGYSQAEIAGLLGITERAVEGRVRRARTRARRALLPPGWRR